jgi:hypothetical protein
MRTHHELHQDVDPLQNIRAVALPCSRFQPCKSPGKNEIRGHLQPCETGESSRIPVADSPRRLVRNNAELHMNKLEAK